MWFSSDLLSVLEKRLTELHSIKKGLLKCYLCIDPSENKVQHVELALAFYSVAMASYIESISSENGLSLPLRERSWNNSVPLSSNKELFYGFCGSSAMIFVVRMMSTNQ